MTHWGLLAALSAAISLAFAFLMRDEPRERLLFGLKMFLGFLLFAFAAGWILFFLPL